jgi:hypothetical protein
MQTRMPSSECYSHALLLDTVLLVSFADISYIITPPSNSYVVTLEVCSFSIPFVVISLPFIYSHEDDAGARNLGLFLRPLGNESELRDISNCPRD